jgi:hypothetical protein
MSQKTLILYALLVVFAAGGSGPHDSYPQGTPLPAAERTATGIAYLSGGVGLDEREALRAVMEDYNLRMTLCAAGRQVSERRTRGGIINGGH